MTFVTEEEIGEVALVGKLVHHHTWQNSSYIVCHLVWYNVIIQSLFIIQMLMKCVLQRRDNPIFAHTMY